MLPLFYQAHLQQCLSSRHYLLVNLLVLLLQWHKQVRLERLAANLPLPIQFEGSRRCLQRLFSSWLPLVMSYLLSRQFRVGQTLYWVLDRTQWQGVNVLMASCDLSRTSFAVVLAVLVAFWKFGFCATTSGFAPTFSAAEALSSRRVR